MGDDIKKFTLKIIVAAIIISASALLVLNIENLNSAIDNIINILNPFIIGLCIAYLILPLHNKLERFFNKKGIKKARGLAITLSEVLLILLASIMLIIIVPQSAISLVNIIKTLPDTLEKLNIILQDLIVKIPLLEGLSTGIMNIEDMIINYIKNDIFPNFNSIAQVIITRATSLGKGLTDILLGIFVSIFALASKDQFKDSGKRLLFAITGNKLYNIIVEEIKVIDKMFSGFIIGKIVDSLIIGFICLIGTWIIGIPYAGLVSLIVCVTNVVPIVGPFIGAIPSIIIIFSESPKHSIYFAVFILLLQQLDGNYIGPKCIGSATNLSTFWVLFAIIFFGGIWGFIGMIVGVPLLAVIFDIINKFIKHREDKVNLVVDKPDKI